MIDIHSVGNAKVYLIAGGGKCYTDIAAKFCRSSKSVEEIIASDYNKKLVQQIVDSGHLAATEFDTYIFGIENVSRVFEAQLIRKRMASYMVSSGRVDHKEIVNDIILPNNLNIVNVKSDSGHTLIEILTDIDSWYVNAIKAGVKAEDARYLLPQGTAKKIIFACNSHGLLDWFKIRCCLRAQEEIRSVAMQILKICKETQPDIFKDAGPSCKALGFCPEHEQCELFKGKIHNLHDIKKAIKENRLIIKSE